LFIVSRCFLLLIILFYGKCEAISSAAALAEQLLLNKVQKRFLRTCGAADTLFFVIVYVN